MSQCQCQKKSPTRLRVEKVENGFIITSEVRVEESGGLMIRTKEAHYLAKNPMEVASIINQLLSDNGVDNGTK